MDKEMMTKLLEKMGVEVEDGDTPMSSEEVAKKAAKLIADRAIFEERHEFKPGDLVVWKPGMKHKKSPPYGCPIVVMEVLEAPEFDTENGSGTPYFLEPLDIICAEEHLGDFVAYYYDSRRFEPYKG